MKNPELFNRTVDILVKAYQNDTLQYTDCCACAVGNIIAANKGLKIVKDGFFNFIWSNGKCPNWGLIVDFGNGLIDLDGLPKEDIEEALEEIEYTGYTPIQIAKIEYAFCKGVYKTEPIDNFNGLMSVVDCLMEIHEANTTEAEQAKSLFVKA